MKFNDGFWRLATGMSALYPRLVRRVARTEKTLTIYAPTRLIENRRNSLNNPVITVHLWSPANGVIGVKVHHHGGTDEPSPQFALASDDTHEVTTMVDDTLAVLTSGDLRAEVIIGDGWDLSFWSGDTRLTSSDSKSIGVIEKADGEHFLHERLVLNRGTTTEARAAATRTRTFPST
jgi:alpha-D-xyloside xylohydrolase